MNERPIETARDADLRLSMAAMLRAAQRARELARQTGTALVISRDGVLEQIQPAAARSPGVLEPPTPDDSEP
ncbi:MAG TPA: hypothetical protein DCY89_02525 [Gammaproteobacteria bacterium]|nr:hypothetical protein [Gammaproteobacteria bacterium]